jgi:cysteine synthase
LAKQLTPEQQAALEQQRQQQEVAAAFQKGVTALRDFIAPSSIEFENNFFRLGTRLAVVDPENSAFLAAFRDPGCGETTCGSRIEGIGRPRQEPSFLPDVIDRLVRVPDAASVAAAHFLRERTGLLAGPSTGTALYAAAKLACDLAATGGGGSVVTLLCDDGVRYLDTYFDRGWVAEQGWELEPYLEVLAAAWDEGIWTG